MKSNFWLFGGLAWLAAASVLAQDAAPDTNPPTVLRSITGPLAKDVLLDPPATGTVKIESLIVRSQPAFAGDILTHAHQGQSVTVLEQITLAKPKLNEPTNWARIVLPTNAAVWVFADYINTNSMTVSATRINVRGGAGDNYGIVARLEKGAPIKQVRRTPDWIQIVPPTNAYGFVASDYLTMQPPAALPPATVAAAEPAVATPATPPPATVATAEPAVATPASTEPATTPAATAPATTPAAIEPATAPTASAPATTEPAAATPVASAPVTPEPVAPPATITTPEASNTPPATVAPPLIVAPEPVPTTSVATPPPAAAVPVEITPSMPSTPPAPAISTTPAGVLPAVAAPPPAATAAPESVIIDPKPRIVTREGYVRKALNIQAPSDYELRDLNSGETIEYLQPAAQDKDFKKYTGAKVSVSGTEWLDQRWPKTPILRIQTVDPMP